MAVVSVRMTENGLQLPEEAVRELGLKPGDEANLEIRMLPDAQAIRHKAMYHCWRSLGDAVGAEPPIWDGDVWTVSLKVKGRSGTYGELTLTAQGDVIPERSSTKQDVLEALDATRTETQAA